MSTTTKSSYDAAIVLAEYIFQNPGQLRNVAQKSLKEKLSSIEFNIAEDLLTDTGIIYGKLNGAKNTTGESVTGYCYFPDEERELGSVRKYLQSHSKN